MAKFTQRPIRVGDNVVRDASTYNQGTMRLGDNTPTFGAGDKVVRDIATVDPGNARLGDVAPVFAPQK
jgi:hypothetical protein